ncbi:MAG: D-2-hydroxyacid dehydrogenase [Candidatus Accumulibacter sp.]|jgi:phosphoglycerate dehydrogenase-like enzyme|nr:D-2-hydroxyacid dehydrogenase [Accumulibacter sp.]
MPDIAVLFKPSKKVPFEFTEEHLARIAVAGGGAVKRFETEEELLESGFAAEILFTWGGSGDMPEKYCRANGRLKWLHSFSAGMDPVMRSPIARLPIFITSSSGIHAVTISETVMGYILAHNRTFPFMFRMQRERVWAKGLTRDPVEAIGKTVGIVGVGAIGGQIALRARAFGMRVLGLRRHPAPAPDYDEMFSGDRLAELLARSDYVVVSTPLTEQTRHLIGAARFGAMKKSALFINVARGGVVDQDALIAALRAGEIAGAALDVTDPEPLPEDSPLWDMENVIITPHMSADAPILARLAVDFFCAAIEKYGAGERPPNLCHAPVA